MVKFGVIKLFPDPTWLLKAVSLYHFAVVPVAQPVAVKVVFPAPQIDVPCELGAVIWGQLQSGFVTASVALQPFKSALIPNEVVSAPTFILNEVPLPVTIPAFDVTIVPVGTVTATV